MQTLRRGDQGEAVLDIQVRLSALGLEIDPKEHGHFGSSTEEAIRAFQQRRQLLVDGLVGEHTWAELVEAGYSLGDRVLYLHYPFYRGDDVRTLQASLNLLGFDAGREDGIFGPRTDRAIREFQRNVGLIPDGIAGATTARALTRLRPVGPGPSRAAVREGEDLLRLDGTIVGARIAIDPGHGLEAAGAVGSAGLSEAEATYLISEALAAELTRRGARPSLLRGENSDPSPSERARAANHIGAELLISVHLNSHSDPSAEGACTFYYGRDDWVSRPGRRLAELIQDELISQLELRDGRTHAMALPLLRETRMPAVHVEPCFITNPREEQLLRDQGFRRHLAVALAGAIDRFLRGERLAAPAHT